MIDTVKIILASVLSLVIVSILWGFTNPLMKRASVGIESIKSNSRLEQLFAEVKFLVLNWRYLLAFAINQIGSILYYWTLGSQDLSTVVIVCNSLTLVFTSLAGQIMGEERDNKFTYAGILLVTCGVGVCVWSKT